MNKLKLVVLLASSAVLIAGGGFWLYGSQCDIVLPAQATPTAEAVEIPAAGKKAAQSATRELLDEIDEMEWEMNGGRNLENEKLVVLIYDGLAFPFGESEEEIVGNLGEPLGFSDEEQKSIHEPGMMLCLRTLRYDGLIVRMYKLEDRDLILEIYVNDPRYAIRHGLNVGATEEYVRSILGEPDAYDGKYMTYLWHAVVGDEQVVFMMEDGKVASVDWCYWID